MTEPIENALAGCRIPSRFIQSLFFEYLGLIEWVRTPGFSGYFLRLSDELWMALFQLEARVVRIYKARLLFIDYTQWSWAKTARLRGSAAAHAYEAVLHLYAYYPFKEEKIGRIPRYRELVWKPDHKKYVEKRGGNVFDILPSVCYLAVSESSKF